MFHCCPKYHVQLFHSHSLVFGNFTFALRFPIIDFDAWSTHLTLPRRFYRAQHRLITLKGAEKKPVDVTLAIGHRIYRDFAKNGKDSEAISLFDFKAKSSLELVRLADSAKWEDIEETIT